MIVEFIGCSGAGKTTLMRQVQRHAAAAPMVPTAWDLVLDRPGRRRVTNPTAVNLVADATALGPFLAGLRRNDAFVRFALRRLRGQAPTTVAGLNYARNVVRRVGMHELARRQQGRTVLVDEGTVLIAYQLFVYSRVPPTEEEIERFASLVPAPDRLVHVRAPTSVLVERAVSRPDRRRELRRADAIRLHHLIERADTVFTAVASAPTLRERVLEVDNPDSSAQRQHVVAQRIAAWLASTDLGSDGGERSDPDGRTTQRATEDP